jgi:hypothetical protein
MQVWICLQLENVNKRKWIKSAKEMCIDMSGKQQCKKCAMPYLENVSKRNVHCHIWRMSVKEMCTATSGEYQKRIVHFYM